MIGTHFDKISWHSWPRSPGRVNFPIFYPDRSANTRPVGQVWPGETDKLANTAKPAQTKLACYGQNIHREPSQPKKTQILSNKSQF
jgi:hypothetical protein